MKYLRFIPLVFCVVLAAAVSIELLGAALWSVLRAGGSVAGWALWVSGPLLYGICLAFLVREKPARIAFDVALVGLMLMDVAVVLLSLLPFVPGRELMFYLPLLQFFGLTGLLVVVMLIRAGVARRGPAKTDFVTTNQPSRSACYGGQDGRE